MYFSEHVLEDSVFTTLTHCIYGIKTHTERSSYNRGIMLTTH